jgi:hypothetical protein
MSQSRRDFLKLLSAGGVAAGVLTPEKALACCFGRQRDLTYELARSDPYIRITFPPPGTVLDRSFTAYGTYSLGGYQDAPTITAKLFDATYSQDSNPVATSAGRVSTWQADFNIPNEKWPNGVSPPNYVTLHVEMNYGGTKPATDDCSPLYLVPPPSRLVTPFPLTIVHPSQSDKEVDIIPKTDGLIVDSDPRAWTIASKYVHRGRFLGPPLGQWIASYPSWDGSTLKWDASPNHDLTGHNGKDGIALVIFGKNWGDGRVYSTSRGPLKIK